MDKLKRAITQSIASHNVAILPAMDVKQTYALIESLEMHCAVSMLDPWYNKGIGGVRDDYRQFITSMLTAAGRVSDHIYFWGFPEIVALFVEKVPEGFSLRCWLTWYYKNNPSVIRGWRSAQQACLHLSRQGAAIHLEPFLNDAQKEKLAEGKLRYIPGPLSVLESALNIGFINRKEQTGHPAQKPEKVFAPLYQMTCATADTALDAMAGSGTTGAIAQKQGFGAILCDHDPVNIEIMCKRLGVRPILRRLLPASMRKEIPQCL